MQIAILVAAVVLLFNPLIWALVSWVILFTVGALMLIGALFFLLGMFVFEQVENLMRWLKKRGWR